MTDQTRADFEAHFQLTTRQKWQHPDGSYKFPEIQAKWEGHLAGVAKAAPVAVPALSRTDMAELLKTHGVSFAADGWYEIASAAYAAGQLAESTAKPPYPCPTLESCVEWLEGRGELKMEKPR